MKRVTLVNISKVQKAIKGTDDVIYYLPPRIPSPLPAGVDIKEGRDQQIKVTVSES